MNVSKGNTLFLNTKDKSRRSLKPPGQQKTAATYRTKFDREALQPQLLTTPGIDWGAQGGERANWLPFSSLRPLLLPLDRYAATLKKLSSLSVFLTVLHQRRGLRGGAQVPRGGGGGSRLGMLGGQLSQGLRSLELLQELGARGAAAFSFADITKSFP